MSTGAVVPAAGRGERVDLAGPRKQFRELGGRPVLERTCRALLADPGVDLLVVVLPPDVARDPPGWLTELAEHVVAGAESRRASVGRGIEAVPEGVDTLLVHDGVRPFVDASLVRRVREAADRGAVIPVLPLRDTVKEVDAEGRIARTLDRSTLRRVQTPQGFPASVLRRVHRSAAGEGTTPSDDAALCERYGIPVHTVSGDERNLKLTTADDFAYGEWLLERGAVPGAPTGSAGS